MNNPAISIIAAIGKNRELGRDNALLFQIPEDMKLFRNKTRGHAVIMGRKTFESIGDPLPNRLNIVLTRQREIQKEGVVFATDINFALEIATEWELKQNPQNFEIFIIGGAQIYELTLPIVSKLYLTVVDKEIPDADAFFPDYHEFKTIVSERKSHDGNYSYAFLELVR